MVIGRKGKIINELQKRLDEEFAIENPKLKVEEIDRKAATLNAQVMAEERFHPHLNVVGTTAVLVPVLLKTSWNLVPEVSL